MKNTVKYLAVLMLLLPFLFNSCSGNVDDAVNSSEIDELQKKSVVENERLNLENATFTFNSNGDVSKVSLNDIKNLWERQILEEEDLNVNLVNFELIKTYDDLDEKYYYFLKTTDEKGQISTGTYLTLNQNKDASLSLKISAGSKECSCKGCPNGCNLQVTGSRCSCSRCFPQTPNSKCEKTEKQVVIT